MSKQTLIDELTKEVNQAKSTYQECDDDLSKRIFETKIRAYSHALDLAKYHIHDGKEVIDINHIESVVMNVINDFTTFIKPSREANAFVFDMLKKSIRLALQEYNLNGGWISVDDMLPEPEIDCSRKFEPTKFYLIQLKSGLIDIVAFVNIYYDAGDKEMNLLFAQSIVKTTNMLCKNTDNGNMILTKSNVGNPCHNHRRSKKKCLY